MRIAGIEKSSFVDYPGRLATVLFTPGCNLDCFYCHNRHLLAALDEEKFYAPQDILNFLRSRQGLIDAVVISGGEPTLQNDLFEFMYQIRQMRFEIKLDTNGLRPWIVKSLITHKLVDFIAMDIKAPLHKYFRIVNSDVPQEILRESIDLIMSSNVEYEFRTTVAPMLTMSDILDIATMIKGAKRYALQQYRQPGTAVDMFGVVRYPDPHPVSFLHQAHELIAKFVQHCEIRGLGGDQPKPVTLAYEPSAIDEPVNF
ncbi:MAG TPA: anaerobic ribonucleoside-triphosphate reductase activating protein [Phycisphaerae bacterium]|nr:anaerobic ribonucleoside-triphosphate reductase activating protein [Phycisphaerae bacterium]HPS52250.1 anaerobic ribonucleoside-triphosphate reductase activating protein [Phycisphaerae bacterium]